MISNEDEKIDRLFENLLKEGEITLIYGDHGTGKTCICFLATLKYIKNKFKVIYITTEIPFTVERIVQLTEKDTMKYVRNLFENIIVITPKTFIEQNNLIKRIEYYISPAVKLLIFDSITEKYREITSKKEVTILANKILNEQMGLLKYIAINRRIAVLITGQLTEAIKRGCQDVVASKVIRYWCDKIIKLERLDDIRYLITEKCGEAEVNKKIPIPFKIVEGGMIIGDN